ncbi:MAG: glycerophosphodiester phosphodiesterase [Acidimicrobiia bacterium]|nr:glycerophosphodiester phosphodiesterase [Acidimicrobiia bacterium]
MHPFLDHATPAAFAHRGGAAEAPENTMAAFEAAVASGYRYLELDVRTTADGELVVFHDAYVDRVTDGVGALRDLRYGEVAELRVDGTATVPRLAEVFEAWPGVRVNIDPKEGAAVAPLARLLLETGVLDRVCIMAFSDARLRRLRRLVGPRLCTALGPSGMTRLRMAASGWPVGRPVGAVAQVPVRLGHRTLLDADVVRTARRFGLPIHVWVVDNPGEMHRLLDLGVAGIMTDRPSVLRHVLVERGQWHDG